MARRPILIDGDFSQSAVAALLAHKSPELALCGVTAAAGRQTAARAAADVRRLLAGAGVGVPVGQGAAGPLLRPPPSLPDEADHSPAWQDLLDAAGEWGACAPDLSASELMAKTLLESEGPVTLVTAGPLTNVALLLMTRPDLKEKIDHITVTGGALRGGDRTPAAEENFFLDPEAANVVLGSGVPAVLLGLDVTGGACLTKEELSRLRALPTRQARLAAALLESARAPFGISARGQSGDRYPLQGACAVLFELAPDLFETVATHLEVETASEFCDGALISDLRGLSGLPRTHRVAVGIDRERAAGLLLERLGQPEGEVSALE